MSESPAPAATVPWRCFHCDEVFHWSDRRAALDHFGRDEMQTPACQIKAGAERGLLHALRVAEDEIAELRRLLHDDSCEAFRLQSKQHGRHASQLTAAEEMGYERGLRDCREQVPLDKVLEVLRPFADAVYNDNGDMTINRDVKGDDLVAAYFLRRSLEEKKW